MNSYLPARACCGAQHIFQQTFHGAKMCWGSVGGCRTATALSAGFNHCIRSAASKQPFRACLKRLDGNRCQQYQTGESRRNPAGHGLSVFFLLSNSPACVYRVCRWNQGKSRGCAVGWTSWGRSLSFFFSLNSRLRKEMSIIFYNYTRFDQQQACVKDYQLSVFVGAQERLKELNVSVRDAQPPTERTVWFVSGDVPSHPVFFFS